MKVEEMARACMLARCAIRNLEAAFADPNDITRLTAASMQLREACQTLPWEAEVSIWRCVHCKRVTLCPTHSQVECVCGGEFYPVSRRVLPGEALTIEEIKGEALGDGSSSSSEECNVIRIFLMAYDGYHAHRPRHTLQSDEKFVVALARLREVQ